MTTADPGDRIITLEKRSVPDQLRYMAAKLLEGPGVAPAVAISLHAVAGGLDKQGASSVTVSREDIRAVVRLARLSRHLAEDPATDRLAAAAGEGEPS
jgi:hypothetical protein